MNRKMGVEKNEVENEEKNEVKNGLDKMKNGSKKVEMYHFVQFAICSLDIFICIIFIYVYVIESTH